MYLYSSIGSYSAYWHNCGYKDDVGDHKQQNGLQVAGVANDVAHPEEEQRGEHGEGHGGEDTLDCAECPGGGGLGGVKHTRTWLILVVPTKRSEGRQILH